MLDMIIAIAIGALAAAAFAALLRMAGSIQRVRLSSAALIFTALLYVLFAVRAAHWHGLAVELVGVVLYGGLALLGLKRRSMGLISAGWALHPVWDIALHAGGSLETYTPGGYAAACLGFDLTLAAWLALSARKPREERRGSAGSGSRRRERRIAVS